MDANKLSYCRFNGQLTLYAPFSIHLVILLLLTILIYVSKDKSIQSITRLCFSLIVTKNTINANCMAL